jgi:hypothetical protein
MEKEKQTGREMEYFIQEIKSNPDHRNDNLCIRFLRKKFKCVIIYTLLFYSFLQLAILLIQKTDDSKLNDLIRSNNETKSNLMSLFFRMKSFIKLNSTYHN